MSPGHSIISAPKTNRRAASIITSLSLSAIGIVGSSYLLLSRWITEGSFVALVIVSVLVGLVIFFERRLKSVSFKNGSLDLEKIEEARIEVEAKREEVTRIAFAIGEITVFLAAFHRRMGSERNHDLEEKWLHQRVSRMLDESNVSGAEREHVFRWLREIEVMNTIKDKSESLAYWNRIWDRIEAETKKG